MGLGLAFTIRDQSKATVQDPLVRQAIQQACGLRQIAPRRFTQALGGAVEAFATPLQAIACINQALSRRGDLPRHLGQAAMAAMNARLQAARQPLPQSSRR